MPKVNRNQQRLARDKARAENISYQEALRQILVSSTLDMHSLVDELASAYKVAGDDIKLKYGLNIVLNEMKVGNSVSELIQLMRERGVFIYQDMTGRLYGATESLRTQNEITDEDAYERFAQFAYDCGVSLQTLEYFQIFIDVSQMRTVRLTIPYSIAGDNYNGFVLTRNMEPKYYCQYCQSQVKPEEMAKRRDQFISQEEEWLTNDVLCRCPHCKKNGIDRFAASQSPCFLMPPSGIAEHNLYHLQGAKNELTQNSNKTEEENLLHLVQDPADVWSLYDLKQHAACAYIQPVMSKEQAKQAVDVACKTKATIVLWEASSGFKNLTKNIACLRSLNRNVALEIVPAPAQNLLSEMPQRNRPQYLREQLSQRYEV
jgi:hypothetical protein